MVGPHMSSPAMAHPSAPYSPVSGMSMMSPSHYPALVSQAQPVQSYMPVSITKEGTPTPGPGSPSFGSRAGPPPPMRSLPQMAGPPALSRPPLMTGDAASNIGHPSRSISPSRITGGTSHAAPHQPPQHAYTPSQVSHHTQPRTWNDPMATPSPAPVTTPAPDQSVQRSWVPNSTMQVSVPGVGVNVVSAASPQAPASSVFNGGAAPSTPLPVGVVSGPHSPSQPQPMQVAVATSAMSPGYLPAPRELNPNPILPDAPVFNEPSRTSLAHHPALSSIASPQVAQSAGPASPFSVQDGGGGGFVSPHPARPGSEDLVVVHKKKDELLGLNLVGTQVAGVRSGSPAERHRLDDFVGRSIKSINGSPIYDKSDFAAANLGPEEQIQIEFGKDEEGEVTVPEQNYFSAPVDSASPQQPASTGSAGRQQDGRLNPPPPLEVPASIRTVDSTKGGFPFPTDDAAFKSTLDATQAQVAPLSVVDPSAIELDEAIDPRNRLEWTVPEDKAAQYTLQDKAREAVIYFFGEVAKVKSSKMGFGTCDRLLMVTDDVAYVLCENAKQLRISRTIPLEAIESITLGANQFIGVKMKEGVSPPQHDLLLQMKGGDIDRNKFVHVMKEVHKWKGVAPPVTIIDDNKEQKLTSKMFALAKSRDWDVGQQKFRKFTRRSDVIKAAREVLAERQQQQAG